MWQFVVAMVFVVIAIIAFVASFVMEYDDDKIKARAGGGLSILISAVFLFLGTTYSVGVGEAKVVVNDFTKSYVRTIKDTGFGFKAPWDSFVDFNTLSQPLTYAGSPNDPPQYTGGKIDGAEVTVTVGGIAGGSTSANVDIVLSYNLDSDMVDEVWNDYKTQENFTKQIIEPVVLEIIRVTPSQYSAVEFRGVKRGEAGQEILKKINDRLRPYGVTVTNVSIQDVRYSNEVERSLTELEVAAQNKERAKLEADAAVTRAQGDAKAKIEQAKGEAEANDLLNKSLTDKVLQARWIEAIKSAGEKGSVIITDGKTQPIIQR